ncbi:Lipid A export ATP-binding/permease MsbA [Cystobacter fuscus]|uniref:Lipid A export ATP-binding/permease MsbA n=1 Tax=Cystobacter fuscus TaxID=43 RepID=A0A250J946_9BACT|nr:ABC transporter transmembrane domain-containing protein [Cystobacter fuscus]ATB40434.1 Lipid A export ATP-binding/permease MsbA [Cystobacter fuscus]
MSQVSSSGVVRRLLALVQPEWRTLCVALFFLLLGSGLSLVYPQAVRFIIDEALGSKDATLIDRVVLAMVVVFAVQAGADSLRYYFFTQTGERIVVRLRHELFSRLVAQEVGFFDQHKTGELTSRLSADTTVLQNVVSANIATALRSGAQVVGGLGMLLYTSPRLTLLMLAVVPPMVITTVLFGRRIRLSSRRVHAALAEATGVADEILSGIRTVRAFAAERHEVGRYRQRLGTAFELARERTRLSTGYVVGTSFGGLAAAALVLWYGTRLMLRGELTMGSLTSFLVYTTLVSVALSGLTDLWAELLRASGAAERVFEMIDRVPAIPSTGGEQLPEVKGRVTYQAVRFAYPARSDVPVLQEIDLELQPGEVVALVGPSGGGKSTIASLLVRLYDPQGGRVMLDGVDLRTLDPEWLRQQVGSVAQEPLLFSDSIADNIRYGRMDATDAEVEAAARAANAHEFISRFPEGYRTHVGERGVQLSGGQKQRIAIARAVLKDPRLLVLDEATSALDAESEHLVQEALDRLMRGRTTLIIAHRLSTVTGADRVLVVEGGRVVQSGSHAALMAQEGLYRRLVARQFVAA